MSADILITLSALAHLAAGYAVNAGFCGMIMSVFPEQPVGRYSKDYMVLAMNMLIGPLGTIVLALDWWEYGRQPFRWDWPGLLINAGDRHE